MSTQNTTSGSSQAQQLLRCECNIGPHEWLPCIFSARFRALSRRTNKYENICEMCLMGDIHRNVTDLKRGIPYESNRKANSQE